MPPLRGRVTRYGICGIIKTMTPKHKTTIRLSTDTLAILAQLAELLECSKSEVIRIATLSLNARINLGKPIL